MVSRWLIRVIGLVNTIILARLLSPEDFGIAAMAALSIGMIETFSEVGAVNLVIRSKDTSAKFIDTGWTFQILQGAIVAVAVVSLAPFLSAYFSEPRLEMVLLFAGLTAFVAGFQSMGVALARKRLDYGADLRFMVFKRVATLIPTLILAVVLRSYWALIVGPLIGAIGSTILSFYMFPRRHRLAIKHAVPFLSFARAAIPMSVAYYLNSRLPTLVVGAAADTHKLGVFNVAYELSDMATNEVLKPIGRVLIPNFAKVVGQAEKVTEAFLFGVQLMLMIALPISFGLSILADRFVLEVLGNQWVEAGSMISWLAIYVLATGVVQELTNNILIAVGKEGLAARLIWARLAFIAPIMIFFGHDGDIANMLMFSTCAVVGMLPVMLAIAGRLLDIPAKAFVAVLWRPVIAGGLMVLGVGALQAEMAEGVLSLLSLVVAGALIYGFSVVVLWLLVGRPAGVEQDMLRAVWTRVARAGAAW